MREEMPKNEDVVFNRQNDRVKNSRGSVENTQHRYVNAAGIIIVLLLALISLSLWLLRLLDVLQLPL